MIKPLEFSRPLKVDRVPAEGCREEIEAEPTELAALAKRFDLPALHSLKAEIDAEPVRGHGLKLNARISAQVEQTCVVTLDNFRSPIEIEAQRIYVPHGSETASEEDDEMDVIHGDQVDLGEFAAEELGLALDPYPRKPGVSFETAVAAPVSQGSPFSGLDKLKDGH